MKFLEVLGVSAFTWTLPWAINLARKAKKEYGIREVWLGSYAVMTEEALNFTPSLAEVTAEADAMLNDNFPSHLEDPVA